MANGQQGGIQTNPMATNAQQGISNSLSMSNNAANNEVALRQQRMKQDADKQLEMLRGDLNSSMQSRQAQIEKEMLSFRSQLNDARIRKNEGMMRRLQADLMNKYKEMAEFKKLQQLAMIAAASKKLSTEGGAGATVQGIVKRTQVHDAAMDAAKNAPEGNDPYSILYMSSTVQSLMEKNAAGEKLTTEEAYLLDKFFDNPDIDKMLPGMMAGNQVMDFLRPGLASFNGGTPAENVMAEWQKYVQPEMAKSLQAAKVPDPGVARYLPRGNNNQQISNAQQTPSFWETTRDAFTPGKSVAMKNIGNTFSKLGTAANKIGNTTLDEVGNKISSYYDDVSGNTQVGMLNEQQAMFLKALQKQTPEQQQKSLSKFNPDEQTIYNKALTTGSF
jgi:hypothetical protein